MVSKPDASWARAAAGLYLRVDTSNKRLVAGSAVGLRAKGRAWVESG